MQYVQSINIQRKMMIMCGRYFIDSDMADKIEKVVHDIDQRVRQKRFAGDIFSNNVAPIIEKSEHGLKLDVCKWGYPLSQGKNLVINARTASVNRNTLLHAGKCGKGFGYKLIVDM